MRWKGWRTAKNKKIKKSKIDLKFRKLVKNMQNKDGMWYNGKEFEKDYREMKARDNSEFRNISKTVCRIKSLLDTALPAADAGKGY